MNEKDNFEWRFMDYQKKLVMENRIEEMFSLPDGSILAEKYEIKLFLMQQGFKDQDIDAFLLEWEEEI